MIDSTPMRNSPMAETYKGMMAKPFSRIRLILPGLIFMGLGIVIVLEPRILVWLIAIALVLVGIMLLMIASFIRNVGMLFEDMREQS